VISLQLSDNCTLGMYSFQFANVLPIYLSHCRVNIVLGLCQSGYKTALGQMTHILHTSWPSQHTFLWTTETVFLS